MKKIKFNTRLDLLEREVEFDYFRSSGPGGQRKNKVSTAVRLRHPPSGITVIARNHRYQYQNRKLALQRLQKRLIELNKEEKIRIPTKIPQRVKEQMLEDKKIKSLKKARRKGIDPEELII